MRISQTGLDLIKHFEGLRLEAYEDIAGILTIGYGHTGTDVYPGQSITEPTAEDILRRDVNRFEEGVSQRVQVPIDQNQFDALVSLAFNIGLGAFGNSTVLKRLNNNDYIGAADAITWWNKATVNGVKTEVAGLTRRRAAEKALFLQDIGAGESCSNQSDSSRVTPQENTPRRGNVATSRTVEGGTIAGAGGAAGAGAAMMDGDDESDDDNDSDSDSDTDTETDVAPQEPPVSPEEETQAPASSDGDGSSDPENDACPADPDDIVTEAQAEECLQTEAAEDTGTDPDEMADSGATDDGPELTTETRASTVDDEGFTREDYEDIFQFVGAAIVILAVIYIILSRIDDWRNFRR